MKKILTLLACAAMVISVAGCQSKTETTTTTAAADATTTTAAEGTTAEGSDFDYITGKGKLIVGITDYAPMDYKDDNGNWTGFDAEFATTVASKMGVEVEFIEIDWDNKFLELNSKSIDCIWNGMTITTEVTENTECSKAYVKNEQVVVMKADKLASYADAASMTALNFSAESGSAGEAAAQDAGFNVTAVGAQSDALMEVASGSADACVIDGTMADAMTGEGTSYADLAAGIALTSEEYGVGFRKGSDMAEKLNGYIAELTTDGTLTALAAKYELSLAD